VTILIAGATGATGRRLLRQLLDRGHHVKTIVRSLDKLPADLRGHAHLPVIVAPILDMSDEQLQQAVRGCDAVISCLGHNVSFKGILGHPRRLVTDATKRLCQAIHANQPLQRVRFILMNTTGNRNRDLDEHRSLGEKAVISVLRLLLPPHVDNEQAAEYLRANVGQDDPWIEWVAVRPDTLTEEERVSDYTVHPSPIRSAIFNAGKTSRINVAHFMAELIADDNLWRQWKGQMPVIYNDKTKDRR
jgi:nucleoside-diphosphate-sugar epimerase